MSRYNERIKDMQNFRYSKNKCKFKNKIKEEKINGNSSTVKSNSLTNRFEKYKKNASSLTKGKNIEKKRIKIFVIKMKMMIQKKIKLLNIQKNS